MTLPEYITATRTTDLVGTVKHAALGLISEVGEVYGVLAKIERGDPLNRAERMTGELGDVAWYLARLCDLSAPGFGLSLDMTWFASHQTRKFDAWLDSLYREAHYALHGVLPLDVHSQMGLWATWAKLCEIEGLDPSLVLESNLAKLRDRAARRVLQGDGDHR